MKNQIKYKQVAPVGDEAEAWETAEPIGKVRIRVLYDVIFSDGFEVTEEVELTDHQRQQIMAILAEKGSFNLRGKAGEHLATAYPL